MMFTSTPCMMFSSSFCMMFTSGSIAGGLKLRSGISLDVEVLLLVRRGRGDLVEGRGDHDIKKKAKHMASREAA